MDSDSYNTPPTGAEMVSGSDSASRQNGVSGCSINGLDAAGELSIASSQTRRSTKLSYAPDIAKNAVLADNRPISEPNAAELDPNGTRSEPARLPSMVSTDTTRTCEQCGGAFKGERRTPSKKNPCRFCSRECSNAAKRGRAIASKCVTPDSTKSERIRANGLVNSRIKHGWFVRPTECAKCGRNPGRTLDSHHGDYMQPASVAFICRSCHMREHHHPGYLAGVATVSIDNRQDGQPIGTGRIHGRGGRKGPTGKAQGRAPYVVVADCIDNGNGTITDVLACGHQRTRYDDGKARHQQRCLACKRAKLAAQLVSSGAIGTESDGAL